MSVTGYLALYTTLIGWQQYQNLWGVMVGVGIVFIPFIGIVLRCFLEPFESQEPKSAAVIAMRRLGINIVGALLIIEFCCVPTVPLDPKVLHFEPECVQQSQVATPGHTGTTYDNQFSVPTGIKVPIIWYLVMAVSNGFTHASIEGISCSSIDYRTLKEQLDLSHIANPTLKKETVEFYNDCYVPAYAKYMSGNLSSSQQSQIQYYQNKYGKDDLGWLGSMAFLSTNGFYDALFAHEPVPGFLYDASRDQFEGQINNHSRYGQPECNDWWSNPQNGLHTQLEQALPPRFLDKIKYAGTDPKVLADIGIRNLISHSFEPGMTLGEISRGYESLEDDIHDHYISRFLGSSIGLFNESLSYYPKLELLINALPVIQALLLMSIYALLAIVIPFSSYRTKFIITGAAIIFAITFWSYLWHLVLHVDNLLIPAMYGEHGVGFKAALGEWLQGGDSGNANTLLVSMIIGTMYIALPIIFLILMSWAGLKVSNIIMNAVNSMKEPGDKSGDKAGAIARDAIKTGISKGL